MLYPAELRGLKVSQRFLAGAGFLWAPRIHYCFRRLGQQLRNLLLYPAELRGHPEDAIACFRGGMKGSNASFRLDHDGCPGGKRCLLKARAAGRHA
jgi:hypothetical protein